MTPEQMIAAEIKRRGMKIKTVSTRAEVKYSCLQPSLKGKRELRADEYLRLCVLLDLDPRGYQQHAGDVR